MTFQIRKLILWPKDSSFTPREVEFETGKVNVITGASRTGKSAIIPIIDYCLASSECNIPIDTIRDYVSWYGIILQKADEQVLIARMAPKGNKSSNDFFWHSSNNVIPPTVINEPNCSLENAKRQLNELTGVPYFNLDGDENNSNSFKARLSTRDLMAFTFQTQDIVANQNILFYKTHAYEHREKLRNWFPYILGAETVETLKARQRLQALERRLGALKREFEKEQAISDGWKANIYGHLRTAVAYGLLEETDFSASDTPDKFIEVSKSLLTHIPDELMISSGTVEASSREIQTLEQEDNELAIKIASIKRRLEDVSSLKTGFQGYGDVVKKRVDRLHISKWISDIAKDAHACPICGVSDHPHASTEISKIANALAIYENEARKHLEIPTAFQREEEQLKQELENLVEKKNANQDRYDFLVSKDKDAKDKFYQKQQMYIFLGHFKASLERFEALLESGTLHEQINNLQAEYDRLKPLVNENLIRRKVDAASQEISKLVLYYLEYLDVEDKYRKRQPEISITDLAIRVMSDEGNWHFLAEIGSASNWLSFHIAAMCAFQEYFSKLPHSCVPKFVIFDQPSQVYFPKVGMHDVEKNMNFSELRDEDLEAVKKIYKTLSIAVSKENSSWQFIVLDHADKFIYGDIENVKEAAVWRDGEKLVPEFWYKT